MLVELTCVHCGKQWVIERNPNDTWATTDTCPKCGELKFKA